MENISSEEKEFLKRVYCKVNYLEYEKMQQELIKENEKELRKRKIKECITLGLLFIVVTSFSVFSDFDFGVIMGSVVLMLLVTSYYEFSLNV
ncbi:hypothetical protein SAMN02745163_03815 [Clostridium cavendishii DSM 21758]|uniref:Uncharacterized protein n=1 Tax=Clostridium cavendishii DSM 21758 TaxID=1121302 RepID=A0A1M6SHP6_9CLOT|nr:hypothetical protein [Clostridium cavendishii]SHK44304.1 hypothetical protein SAMN02745163_03815 [Clostridium cavendishii DSM 21758]